MPPPTSRAQDARAGERKGGRRRWFDLHSWVGMKLCVLMAFICITGTLAVFAQEIDWLLHKEMRVTPIDRRASWGEMVDAARSARPQWTLDSLTAPHASRFAAMAIMHRPDGQLRFVWIDPYRGVVTGDTARFNVHRLLRNTHRHLMMPLKIGVPLVSALSIPLVVTFVTSLVIYKRWWRGFATWPRAERPRRLWGDVHRLLGVWSLWFIALIALTSLWYLVESLGGGARPVRLPKADESVSVAHRAPGAGGIDAAVAGIGARWPALRVRGLQFDGATLQVIGQADAWLVRDRANAVALDLRDGRTLGAADGRDLGLHQRISEMADPLHFGSFGGWPIRLLWCLAGAALSALSLSGAYLYGLRVADALRAAARKRGRA